MAEDYGLCTFEKHHKLKILLFLSSMRSYKEELKTRGFRVIYNDCNSDFKTSYETKLEKVIKEKKIKEVNFFEIEDIFFEKKLKNFLKKKNLVFNSIKSPMFLTSREEFKQYLSTTKKPFMANFYKLKRSKNMSNSSIDNLYSYALKNGALGGKLIGAGGGGFLLFYTNNPKKLRNALKIKKLEEVSFKFDYQGVKQIF